MKRTVMLAVMFLLLLSLASCGSSSDDMDPFVGTWNDGPDSRDYWVISKTAGTYSVTGFVTTFDHCERQGDKLTCWVDDLLRGKPRIKMTFTSTGPDKLMLTDAWGPGLHMSLHKVSSGTDTPSPFYGHESPSPSP